MLISAGLTAYSLHPGIVKTNLQKSDPSLLGKTTRTLVGVFANVPPIKAALNSLYLATSPDAPEKGQGRYFAPVGKVDNRADEWLLDAAGNAALWRHGEEVLNQLA